MTGSGASGIVDAESKVASWMVAAAGLASETAPVAGAAAGESEAVGAWAKLECWRQNKSMPAAGRVIHLHINLLPRFRLRGDFALYYFQGFWRWVQMQIFDAGNLECPMGPVTFAAQRGVACAGRPCRGDGGC